MDSPRERATGDLRSMKAYVYTAPIRLEILSVPRPAAREDSAVMEVSAASICGTDIRTHRFGNNGLVPPRIIGHEACGIIREVGAKVKGVREGDRVFVVPAIGCGVCRGCRRGRTNMCENLRTVGFEYDGTFAEYVEIPPQAFAMGNVLAVDPALTDSEASLVEPVACCLNGQSFLGIEPEDTVFIFGAGFIGCMHAQLALRSGSSRVIVCDVSAKRLSLVASLLEGVELVDSFATDVHRFVQETTDGRGVDVVITACAVGATHAAATQIAARRARISLFGGLSGTATGFLDSNAIHYKELSVFGSHASTVAENRTVMELVAGKRIAIEKFISRSYSLDRIEEAFEELKTENVLKVLITP